MKGFSIFLLYPQEYFFDPSYITQSYLISFSVRGNAFVKNRKKGFETKHKFIGSKTIFYNGKFNLKTASQHC